MFRTSSRPIRRTKAGSSYHEGRASHDAKTNHAQKVDRVGDKRTPQVAPTRPFIREWRESLIIGLDDEPRTPDPSSERGQRPNSHPTLLLSTPAVCDLEENYVAGNAWSVHQLAW